MEKINEMKKATAIATAHIAKATIEKLAKFCATHPGIEAVQPIHEIRRLNELHEFLQKMTEKEFEEISTRKPEVKLKSQITMFS